MSPEPQRLPDWEAFYRDYRKPGYIPGFEITTKLGGGMFGLVFRARRMSIGKDYAIKFLQVDDGEVRKAVLSELEQVKYFAQIDHPNLVSIEDRGEVDGIPYLVMAFAGTETLRDKIVAGEVPTGAAKEELLRWFLQCCRGLAALHERSLVHFDIKPANVFLKGGVARLGDYGLSKLVTHSRGSLSMGRGTPYYMAPEMLQRRGDHRSDVYSLGVMLYELLCGKMPFTGDSEWEVLKKHETARPELPDHLHAREVSVLQRCLQKDPAARFQSVHDLIAAFGAPTGAGVDLGPPPLPSAASAARLERVVMPHCVVPPLPSNGAVWPEVPPPLPAGGAAKPSKPRRATPARRNALPIVLALGLTALLFGSLFWGEARATRRSRNASVPAPWMGSEAEPVASRPVPSLPDPRRQLAAQIDQLVQSVLRSARNASQREDRVSLHEFEPKHLGAPDDQHVYRRQVEALAKARTFSVAQAAKVIRLGRPTMLAAVALLQGYDYDDADDRRRASNLLRYLQELTGIQGLTLEATNEDAPEADICRFHAIADGWRQVAMLHAPTEDDFRRLLAATGKRTER